MTSMSSGSMNYILIRSYKIYSYSFVICKGKLNYVLIAIKNTAKKTLPCMKLCLHCLVILVIYMSMWFKIWDQNLIICKQLRKFTFVTFLYFYHTCIIFCYFYIDCFLCFSHEIYYSQTFLSFLNFVWWYTNTISNFFLTTYT